MEEQGWGYPGTSRKAHFFPRGEDTSLCRKWGFYFGYRQDDKDEHKENCAECKKRVVAYRAKESKIK